MILAMALPAGDDSNSAESILRELIVNQYQAILLGGVVLASLLTLNPMPVVLWIGGELVVLPMLDSGPLRRWVARRRRERARKESLHRRKRVIDSFTQEFSHRYGAMESNPPLEKLPELLAELSDQLDDTEHGSVALTHASQWCLGVSHGGYLTFENLEEDDEPRHMANVSPDKIIRLWESLARGDLAAIESEPWETGY